MSTSAVVMTKSISGCWRSQRIVARYALTQRGPAISPISYTASDITHPCPVKRVPRQPRSCPNSPSAADHASVWLSPMSANCSRARDARAPNTQALAARAARIGRHGGGSS